MEVLSDVSSCPRPTEGTVTTIGAYDGVHLGHRAVIREVRRRASEAGLRTAVVTFDRHPAAVVRPESAPRLLTDLDHKLELLASTGVDYTLVVHFDEERAEEEPEHFVRSVLLDCLNSRVVVVGEDFHFGHHRRGNVALLRELGAREGFEVDSFHLVGRDGQAARDDTQVSSTAIRRALVEGRLGDAEAMLGRPYELRGPVVEGDRRGRDLGFPTANVAIGAEMLIPADGIYAGWLRRASGESLPAAIYLGRRPTFYQDQEASVLEVHVLDFDGDLYGERVAVRLDHHLRGDEAYPDVDQLVRQLEKDCDQARKLLAMGER